jgi:hypothetical protein
MERAGELDGCGITLQAVGNKVTEVKDRIRHTVEAQG